MFPFDYLDAGAGFLADGLKTDIVTMRLVVSVLTGYPLAITYSLCSARWSVPQREVFLLLSGIFLCVWNFGFCVVHMFVGIFVTLFVAYLFSRSKLSVLFAFVFNMTYLLVGTCIYNHGTYDINWTTPYCILCLRLIGLTWDLYDASIPESLRSEQQNRSALSEFPSVLDVLSFCFVPTAFISGPQFPMRHYKSFLDGSLRPYTFLLHRTFAQRFVYNVKVQRTVIRFTMGLLSIVFLSQLLPRFSAEFMLTAQFLQRWSFFSRFLYLTVFSQLTMLRYIAVWLIGEGACVLLGLGCTGYVHVRRLDSAADSNTPCPSARGRDPLVIRNKSALARCDSAVPWTDVRREIEQWTNYDSSKLDIREAEHTACASISLGNLLLATNTDHVVAGFNINTNKWMLEYVYKRLKFLGNRQLSQFITLTFLAIWHGLASGYFVNFLLEFVTIAVERDFLRITKRSKYAEFLYHTRIGYVLTSVVGKLHVLFMLATPLTAFYLLHFHLWFPVLKSTYFVGFIYFVWPVIRPVMKLAFPVAASHTQLMETDEVPPNGSMAKYSEAPKKSL